MLSVSSVILIAFPTWSGDTSFQHLNLLGQPVCFKSVATVAADAEVRRDISSYNVDSGRDEYTRDRHEKRLYI